MTPDNATLAWLGPDRDLFDTLPDGIFIAQNYRFVMANASLLRMLGYELAEFVGLPFASVISAEDLALWNERFAKRIGAGPEPPRTYDVGFRCKNGQEIEFELVATRATHQGSPAVVGTVRDISERKRLTAELDAHRYHLEDLVANRTQALKEAFDEQTQIRTFAQTISDNQPTLLAFIDRDLRIQFANRSVLAWIGKSREEVIGHLLADVVGTGTLQWDDDYIARVFRGEVVERQMTMSDANGVHGEFLTYRVPEVRDGVVVGYHFIATDVTALRRAETKLLEANEALKRAGDFMHLVADNIPGRVAYWDSDLRCRFANRGYCEWLGKTQEELLDRTAREILGEQLSESSIDAHAHAALAGQDQEFESEDVNAAGQRSISLIRYTPDIDAAVVKGFFVFSQDVTAKREEEEVLGQLNASLIRARNEAMAADRAKTAFLANMSHEIRTPINAILGLSHLALRDSPSGKGSDRLKRIGDAAHHLLAVINGILDLTKIESGKFSLEEIDFSLELLLSKATSMVSDAAQDKGLELVIDSDHLPLTLRGDPTRLSQALVNLLGNAVKFTSHGHVAVAVRLEQKSAHDIRVRFDVSDTGRGVNPGDAAKLFSAFAQADTSTTRQFGGTGLGLVITRHLARLMGGDAGFHNAQGGGSTFWFTAQLRVRDWSVEDPHKELTGLRALVVDDLAEARLAISSKLTRLGLDSKAVATGAQALAELFRSAPTDDRFDLVLVDMSLPASDLLALADWARGDDAAGSTRIVLVGASADAWPAGDHPQLVTGLLAKPVTLAALRETLLRAFSNDAALSAPNELEMGFEQALRTKHAGVTVLLAEDNLVNQEVATSLIEMAGLRVDVANDGREAVDMASARDYALILMDMQMPGLDGIEATRVLRMTPRNKNVPIIAMTANAYFEDRDACLAAGMNDFLSKPVDPPRLYEVLTRWLDLAGPQAEQPVASHALGSIQGLDVARGKMFFAGNEAALLVAVRTFADMYADGLQLSAPADDTPSFRVKVRRELHSFGGACASIGAVDLQHLVIQAMDAIDSASMSRLQECLDDLDREVVDLVNRLRATLPAL